MFTITTTTMVYLVYLWGLFLSLLTPPGLYMGISTYLQQLLFLNVHGIKTFVFRIQFQKLNLQHTQVPLFPNPTRKIPEPMNFEKKTNKNTHHTHQQQNQNIFVNPCFLRVFSAKPCLCSRCYIAQPRGEQHCPNSHLPAMMGGGHGPTRQSSTIK